MNTSQAIASLCKSIEQGDAIMGTGTWSGGSFSSAAVRHIVKVQQPQGELFDAASAIMEWLQSLPPKDRPIARFNRLLDALNAIREAHQMDAET